MPELILLGYMIYTDWKDRKAQRRAAIAYNARMRAVIRKAVEEAYPPKPTPKPLRSWQLP